MSRPGPPCGPVDGRRGRTGGAPGRWGRSRGTGAVLVVVVVVVAVVVAGPWLLPDPDRADFAALLAGPSPAHPLGTDQLGRDLLARTLHGGRVTVGLSLLAVALTAAAGIAVGALAAATGAFGRVLMRVVDVLAAIPVVLFGLVAAVTLGPGGASLLVAVTAIAWTPFARQTHLLALAERERDYVTAAVALGAGPVRVLLRHVGPNLAPPLLAHACVRFAGTLLTISGLSFLGLGIQPPTAEWGAMVAEGRQYLFSAPQVVLVPSAAVVLTAATALVWGRRRERGAAPGESTRAVRPGTVQT
ncbi:ABC transporter permease [Pseudonocardia sp. HH130630-07]|uniref:ABC transporter permease n=1 Tax=Pseudonocardia sp. HH130630-07 TaxID=1690815 RepID=UPI00081513DA|nr:ABC transporter permease [Pseudonocardia sp. HH130630-07]ANY07168.1 hypothetical protein AFB00_13745 [Pseudonocardia sp. HH130630-07]